MALLLPFLRLWLLFINIYGTFKVIKPPVAPQSQRSNRNGQGPSARAFQLRKRELKSRLAMWIVWASFLVSETFLDRTAGIITPFYDELKCVGLLFLLITRSHGAEAIFLHLIHPFVRPYVPAVDDILGHLNSVFELFILLMLIPYEHFSFWWSKPWRWPFSFPFRKRGGRRDSTSDYQHDVPSQPGSATQLPEKQPEQENQVRSRLRPRTQSQRSQFQEAEQHAKVILNQIDEAQDRVRTRTRSTKEQLSAIRDQIQQSQNHPPSVSAPTGLRTRKRLLENSVNNTAANNAGSKTTGVHHLDPLTIAQLATKPKALGPLPHQPSDSLDKQHHSKRQHTIPSDSERLSRESRASDGLQPLHPEAFFQIALESSIHTDMDVDTETLSTLNGSSATEESTHEDTQLQATVRKRNHRQSPSRHAPKRRVDDAEPFRRSTRLRSDETTTSKDEIGDPVQSGPRALPRRQPAAIRKKPLARTKPTLKSDGEILSDDTDTESLKKKRKTKTSLADQRRLVDEYLRSSGMANKPQKTTATDVPRGSTKQVAETSKTAKRNKRAID